MINFSRLLALSSLSLILQACYLPKFFWWQVPLGLLCFYFATISLLARKAIVLNSLSIIIWVYYSYVVYSPDIFKSLVLNSAKIEVPFDYENFKFATLSEQIKIIETARYSLLQQHGRIALIKVQTQQGLPFRVAIVELEDFLSSAGWEDNKILLRRLASILRQEEAEILVLLKGQGPYFQSYVRALAFQARLDQVSSDNPIAHILGFGGWVKLSRQQIKQII